MPEVRVWREGTLRWVEASAGPGISATGWVTGAAVATATSTAAWGALSGLIGFVQPGFTFNYPREFSTPEDRGTPVMHKWARVPVVEATFRVLDGITGDWPTGNTAIGPSALGLTNPPQFHFEFREQIPAVESNLTGIYYQLMGARILDRVHTEQAEGNMVEFRVRAMAVQGPTGSGYLS